MRARNKIFHIDCFRCVACSRQLIPGDEFALRDDGLFCKADHEVVERATNTPNGSKSENSDSGVGSPSNNNNNESKPNLHASGKNNFHFYFGHYYYLVFLMLTIVYTLSFPVEFFLLIAQHQNTKKQNTKLLHNFCILFGNVWQTSSWSSRMLCITAVVPPCLRPVGASKHTLPSSLHLLILLPTDVNYKSL